MSQEDQYRVADPGGFFYSNPNSKKNQKPEQPDYVGAAKTQAGGSIGTSIANSMMGHNNVISPLGKQTWDQIGSNTINVPGVGEVSIPRFQQNIELSPEQQRLYEGQTALQGGLMQQFGQNASQDFPNSAQDVADKAYGAMTSRLDPQWAQREEQQRSTLANQGLVAGGEAYDNAMREFHNARNDAYQQANLGAIQTMPQTYQIEQGLRDLPLNEMIALRNGSAVNMPQFAQGQPGTAQGPNTLQAMGQQGAWQQAMYNAGIQQQNAQTQGLMGLGSAALMFL